MERRLAAILAADAVGFSRLMEVDEEGTLAALNACRQVIDGLIADHHGRVFGSAGDSVIAEFASPVEAVRCAIEVQQGMEKFNAETPQGRRMHFRIGVNLGDVMAEGGNLIGDSVNMAARLQQLAEPGGIHISGTVFDHVKRKVVREYEDLGEQTVKNIAEPVRVYRVKMALSDATGPDPALISAPALDSGEPAASALSRGHEAMKRHAWTEAFASFSEAGAAVNLAPEDLEALSESAWWNGRLDDCIDTGERAFTGYLEQGNRCRAAVIALFLAEYSYSKLAVSVASGWISRAERLLEDEPEAIEHGYLARLRARIALEGLGDLDSALEHAERASALGIRSRDRDLEMLALHDRGCILMAMGQTEDGMPLMEEAMVAAVAGELGAMTTGRIYCNMIEICEKLADYRRAGEWDEEAKRWCDRVGHDSGFPGICRVKRAEIMRLRGSWEEAEQEARRASGELKELLSYAGAAFHQLGEIRLHVGDHDGAEDAFRQARHLGRDPQPGLARLRLAQGNTQAARNLIDRALMDDTLTRLDRARLLPARIEIALAARDLDAARSDTGELRAIAGAFGSRAFGAAAGAAEGRLRFAEDQFEEAAESLLRSCKLCRESGLPYEEARSRLMLGVTYRAQGTDDLADLEFDTARSAFERLGAKLDARHAAELLSHGAAES